MFCHLHCHSHYSLLDGLCSPEELAQRAKELKMPAVALTDHGNMHGTLEFYTACKAVGVKPILGMEAYVAPKSRYDRAMKKNEIKFTHLTLLAKNNEGYSNLTKLATIGYTEGFYYHPRIDLDLLRKHRHGLICLSGCMSSFISKALIQGAQDDAEDWLVVYKDLFGEDLYLEIMDTGIKEQKDIIIDSLELAHKYGIPLVATNDVHFIHKADIDAHKAIMCIAMNRPISKVPYDSRQNYFKTEDEMQLLFDNDMLWTSGEIAAKCDVEIELRKRRHIYEPESAFNTLKSMCGIKISQYPEEYKKRCEYELQAIKQTGYAEYIMVVADFVQYAKSHGIPVGAGRGSSSGSLVCYILGITEIDPLKNGLIFERFINKDRIEPPDIDVDVCQARRGEVLEYLKQKYGENHVAQITTFGTFKTKLIIKDLLRVLGAEFHVGNQLCKLIQEPWEGTVQEALALPQVRTYVSQTLNMHDADQLYKIAPKLDGKPRHVSTHAAGVVISDAPLIDLVPLYVQRNQLLTQYDMHAIEKLGLLKFDVLGLRTLTVIDNACKLSGITSHSIPLDDYYTFNKIRNEETVGVFQYEGYGYRRFIRRMQPQTFDHLVALGALYRPGPLNSGMADDYIERMHGRDYEKEELLEETYGIMLYQEQIMNMVVKYAGFTLNEADTLRKAIGKKDKELMDTMIAKIPDKELAEKIITFARYGWNKAHAVAYALLSYQTAYLKANYPTEYFCALLNSEISDQKRLTILLTEARKCGIGVEQPHINLSDEYYTIHNDKIYAGLLSIRGIGSKSCQHIIEERDKGKYKGREDLRARITPRNLNAVAYQALVLADVFRPMPAQLQELHIDVTNTCFLDKVQLMNILGENKGESRVVLHDCDSWHPIDLYVKKNSGLLNKIKQFCKILQ